MACIRLKIAASAAGTRQAPKAQPGTHAAIRDKGFWDNPDDAVAIPDGWYSVDCVAF